MTNPRFVIDTDEEFKKRVMIKAIKQGRPIKDIVLDLLTRWLKK